MTVAGFDLEKGVFSMLPGLVDRALGFARSWFQGALEWVCGDPAALTEAGQRYLTLGQQVETLGTSISTNAIGVDQWTGEAADGFRTTMTQAGEATVATGQIVAATQEILNAAAEVATEAANLIWSIVTDLVKQLIQTYLVAQAAAASTFGGSLAAWLISAIGQVSQVVARVAQVVGQVGQMLQQIVAMLQKLATLIAKYKPILDRIEQVLRKVKEMHDKVKPLLDKVDAVPTSDEVMAKRPTISRSGAADTPAVAAL